MKPWEIDVLGHMSAPFYIHRFSDALMHALARFGMTPAYLRENRVGFSTFELQGRFRRELRAGDPDLHPLGRDARRRLLAPDSATACTTRRRASSPPS